MSPIWRSICPHKSAGLWPLPLKTVHRPQTSLQRDLPGPSPPAPQRPGVAPAAPASKTPRSCLRCARWSPGCASAPPARAGERGQCRRQPRRKPALRDRGDTSLPEPAPAAAGAWRAGMSFQSPCPPQRNAHAPETRTLPGTEESPPLLGGDGGLLHLWTALVETSFLDKTEVSAPATNQSVSHMTVLGVPPTPLSGLCFELNTPTPSPFPPTVPISLQPESTYPQVQPD